MINDEMRKAQAFANQVRSGEKDFDWANSPKHLGKIELMMAELEKDMKSSDKEILLLSNPALQKKFTSIRLLEILSGFMSLQTKAEKLMNLNTKLLDVHARENA